MPRIHPLTSSKFLLSPNKNLNTCSFPTIFLYFWEYLVQPNLFSSNKSICCQRLLRILIKYWVIESSSCLRSLRSFLLAFQLMVQIARPIHLWQSVFQILIFMILIWTKLKVLLEIIRSGRHTKMMMGCLGSRHWFTEWSLRIRSRWRSVGLNPKSNSEFGPGDWIGWLNG